MICESGRSRTAPSMVNSYLINAPCYILLSPCTRHRAPLRPLLSWQRTYVIARLHFKGYSSLTVWTQYFLLLHNCHLHLLEGICPCVLERYFATPEDTLHPVTGERTYTTCQRTANLSVSLCHHIYLLPDSCKGIANFCNCKFLVIVLSKFIVHKPPVRVSGILIFG